MTTKKTATNYVVNMRVDNGDGGKRLRYVRGRSWRLYIIMIVSVCLLLDYNQNC